MRPWLLYVAAFYVLWIVLVAVFGFWRQALAHWPISVAMTFGSVVAGSTPLGGGTVAFQHLVMAALVFPQAVKILLEREGHYVLTDDDRDRCFAIDKLLAVGWDDEPEEGGPLRWRVIVSEVKKAQMHERIMRGTSGSPDPSNRPSNIQ